MRRSGSSVSRRQIELDYDRYAPIAAEIFRLVETAAQRAVATLPPGATPFSREQLMKSMTDRRCAAIGHVETLIEVCIQTLAPPHAPGARAQLNAQLSYERSHLW